MQDFQQRVVDEKRELDDKISRLKPFVEGEKFKELPPDERARMNRQLFHMECCAVILGERIAAFQ